MRFTVSNMRQFHAYLVSKGGVPKYVGITKRGVMVRWSEHKKTQSQNTAMANAIRKHGVDAFTVEHIASAIDYESLCAIERSLIEQYGTMSPKGYNLKEGGKQCFKFSEETKARMSAGRIGKIPSEETRARLRAAHKLRPAPLPPSAETRAKMSASRKGRVLGPMPEARKAKISAAKSGKPGPPVSASARAKIAASKLGKPGHIPTAETRAKMSAARKGQKRSTPVPIETRIKMSVGRRAGISARMIVPAQTDLFLTLPSGSSAGAIGEARGL